MIIKIMYPNNTAEAELGIFPQEFVYEVSSYSLKHIYQRDDPQKFYDIVYSRNGILSYMLPPGLELKGPLFNACTCEVSRVKDVPISMDMFLGCECNDFCGITLLTLYNDKGEELMMPILLRHCKTFVVNDKGMTVDKIYVD